MIFVRNAGAINKLYSTAVVPVISGITRGKEADYSPLLFKELDYSPEFYQYPIRRI